MGKEFAENSPEKSPSKELKRRLDAAIESLSDRRLRWLIGRGKPLVEEGKMTSEEYERLIEVILLVEIERKMILDKLKSGPLVLSEISKGLPISPKQTFKHLIALRRWNVVAIVGEKKGELEFMSLL